MLSNATAAAIALLETDASTGNPLSFSPGLVLSKPSWLSSLENSTMTNAATGQWIGAQQLTIAVIELRNSLAST
jgi:hypothetical protein